MRWSPFSPIAPGYQSASLSASPPPAAPSLSEFPFLPNFVSFVLPGQDVGLFIHSRSRAPRRFPSPPLGHDRAMRESLDLQRHSKGAFSHHATFMEVYTQWNAVWKFSVTRSEIRFGTVTFWFGIATVMEQISMGYGERRT